jgi:hypothetical protein
MDQNSHPNAIACFFLTFFLGFLGSIIINAADLAPQGYRSRSWAYFIFGFLTCGIYSFVASICNFAFDSSKPTNIGYAKKD